MSPDRIAELLLMGAAQNRGDPLRGGQMLHLPARGDLIVAGDLHNHARNFERIIHAAALDRHPTRHLILQELIHGGPLGVHGEDTSIEMLANALAYAQKFPGRVHFLLANHDLAQVQKIPIMKDGYDLTDRFNRYFETRCGKDGARVEAAFRQWVYTLPFAAITVSGIFFSHSLPNARDIKSFDPSILRRTLGDGEYDRSGSIYKLVWGRAQTPEVLVQLARVWWADLFVCGHQQQDQGWGTIEPNMLIIDSSHNHGTLLQVDFERQYTLADLTHCVVPLASLH
jgi:hypothetical protein